MTSVMRRFTSLDISDSDCVRKFTYNSLVLDLLTTYYLPMHATVAGFGVQDPFGDTPSDVHTAVILPVGTNPVSHLKSISAPPSVLGIATMEPLSGAAGIPQLTERNILNKTIAHIECCTRKCCIGHVISAHAG